MNEINNLSIIEDDIEKADLPEMVTVRQLAKRCALSEYGIRKLVRENAFPTVKVGNKVLINYDRFVDYLNGNL